MTWLSPTLVCSAGSCPALCGVLFQQPTQARAHAPHSLLPRRLRRPHRLSSRPSLTWAVSHTAGFWGLAPAHSCCPLPVPYTFSRTQHPLTSALMLSGWPCSPPTAADSQIPISSFHSGVSIWTQRHPLQSCSLLSTLPGLGPSGV